MDMTLEQPDTLEGLRGRWTTMKCKDRAICSQESFLLLSPSTAVNKHLLSTN